MTQITKEELGFPDISDRIYEMYIDKMFELTGKKEPTEETLGLWIRTWFEIFNNLEIRLQQSIKSLPDICHHCFKSVDGYLEEGEEQWFCPHCGEENLN